MNEELIKHCAMSGTNKTHAVRLYHDKAVAPLAAQLTRPLIGIENRTAQEVFDIMCDRIRAAFDAGAAPWPIESAPASNGSLRFLAHITGHGWHVCWKCQVTGKIYSSSGNGLREIHRATHWTHLPPAPALAPFQQSAALSALAETDGPHVGEARDAAD